MNSRKKATTAPAAPARYGQKVLPANVLTRDVPMANNAAIPAFASRNIQALPLVGTRSESSAARFWPALAGSVGGFALLMMPSPPLLLGYLWLLSQLLLLPGLRDGLLQNPSGQLVFQQFTVIVGIVVAFYFVASGAVNVAAKLASTRLKEISDVESKFEAFNPVELGEREYLARREAAKQS